ncbi:hypothetical protein CXU18_00235 [Akkermansia muciniphila]|jgi:hypothetical protein|nr:hypothetical protein CXU18_00235 [Akkermansia muciniphila]DAJ78833.1 MAG TPA: Reverse gyrase zinc finger [Caudoviricetes sp.]
MSPEEREKKRRWMVEYNRRREASSAIGMTRPPQSCQYLADEQAAILEQAACRDCPNCKYHDLLTKQSPCRDCYPYEDQRLWEPRKEGE